MGPGCTGGRGGRCRAAPRAQSQWGGRGGQTTGAGTGHSSSWLGSICWKGVRSSDFWSGALPVLPHRSVLMGSQPPSLPRRCQRTPGCGGGRSSPGGSRLHARRQPARRQPRTQKWEARQYGPRLQLGGGRSPSREEAVGESSRAPRCAARTCHVPPLLLVVVAGCPQALLPASPRSRVNVLPRAGAGGDSPDQPGLAPPPGGPSSPPAGSRGGPRETPSAATRTKRCPKVLPDGLFGQKVTATALTIGAGGHRSASCHSRATALLCGCFRNQSTFILLTPFTSILFIFSSLLLQTSIRKQL